MKLLGLNSPEIFIILVILLSILGPKRVEKGFKLFKKLLKFLLSKDEERVQHFHDWVDNWLSDKSLWSKVSNSS